MRASSKPSGILIAASGRSQNRNETRTKTTQNRPKRRFQRSKADGQPVRGGAKCPFHQRKRNGHLLKVRVRIGDQPSHHSSKSLAMMFTHLSVPVGHRKNDPCSAASPRFCSTTAVLNDVIGPGPASSHQSTSKPHVKTRGQQRMNIHRSKQSQALTGFSGAARATGASSSLIRNSTDPSVGISDVLEKETQKRCCL